MRCSNKGGAQGGIQEQQRKVSENFGSVSDEQDSEICEKCPMDEWPNLEKTECIPKLYEYLSYKDEIAAFFCFSVILCCAMTCYTLRKFILFWDTPLVKANNRTLSFILLVSILLSFLCIFLFLGRPLDITCMLRQTLFGIFFTLAISSLLAKSIIVCIAFKATKPSSSWRKFTGVLFPNLIVLVCSLLQLLICLCWLVICPPYQEFNMSTYPGTIIIQCNEGSDIWFYSMLGYLGLLAAVSFFLAFMVRKLPDSFNEAKYITFSMLVFCSVWIAMIPAYLSTRGKYMVALEIFAILTSCAGILSCIFFPKLYSLLVNPEINIRKQSYKYLEMVNEIIAENIVFLHGVRTATPNFLYSAGPDNFIIDCKNNLAQDKVKLNIFLRGIKLQLSIKVYGEGRSFTHIHGCHNCYLVNSFED
ncbi:vomeronasal type-2 receptor 26-like [Anomaloglossus baeobatrachus]